MIAETKLVERLRSIARGDPNTDEWSRLPDIHWEAADAIERLTAERDSAYESLRRTLRVIHNAEIDRKR
jgi:hypothetical protein